jgi:hypothetical protein
MIFLGRGLGGVAHTLENLEWIAVHELVPEIREAASIALADRYVGLLTLDQLHAASESNHLGIRRAAEIGLQRFDDPLVSLFLESTAALEAMAESAPTADGRLNAARAYYIKIRETLTVEALERDAAEGTLELAIAAGEVLGGFYVAYGIRTEAELLLQVVGAEAPGLRHAASVALAGLWIRASLPLTDAELQAKILATTLWQPDLAQAYMGVLVDRFRHIGETS